jgi:putative transposase
LVYQHWSGTQKAVVNGINLITLLWTDGVRCIPIDYRIFDKDRDGKTKNDHFAEMLFSACSRGFNPELVCFDSWYASIENLKLCRSLGWHFLTRLRENRKVRISSGKLQAVSQAGLTGGNGTIVWLKNFGEIKVFCVRALRGHGGILGDQFERTDRRAKTRASESVVAHRNVSSSD